MAGGRNLALTADAKSLLVAFARPRPTEPDDGVLQSPEVHDDDRVPGVGSGMRARRLIGIVGLVLVVVAVSLGAVACSDSGNSSSSVPVFHEGDSISVKNGQEFVVALTANPSTGYTWDAGPNNNVKYLSSKQVNASSGAIGAAGTQELRFKATKTGSSTLGLAYARQFEGGVPPAQTASFDVTVK